MGSRELSDDLLPLRDLGFAWNPDDTDNTDREPTQHGPAGPRRGRLSLDSGGSVRRLSLDSGGSIHVKESVQTEGRKILIHRDRRTAIRDFVQFHMIPLGGAITLIVLNIQTRFFGTDDRWSNLLQFVAKLHEILMQISIATAMLAYSQHLLTQATCAVPFGAIFSAYHTTQVGYLLSPLFRGSLTAPGFPTVLKMSFVLFVPASILLASVVGPASAIAMLPRPVNFTVPDYELGLDHTLNDLFPMALAQPGAPLENDIFKENEQSPAIGWEYLRSLPSVGQDQPTLVGTQQATQDLGGGSSRSVDVMPPLYSVDVLTVVQDTLSMFDTFTRSLYVQFAPNGTMATVQPVPVAAGLSKASLNSLAAVNGGATDGEASILTAHPLVSTICVLNPIMNEDDSRPIQFPVTHLAANATAVETTPYTNITRQQIWNETRNEKQGQAIWVDDVSFSTERTLGVIVTQPDLCDNGEIYISMSACAVSGLWANMTSRMAISPTSTMFSGRVESLLSPDFLNTVPEWAPHAVSISKDWANSITSEVSNQNRTVADNLLRTVLLTENVCPPNGSYPEFSTAPRPVMHEAIVSSLVANAMSHAAGPFQTSARNLLNGNFEWQTVNGPVDKPPALVLTFPSRVLGFGWNMDGAAIRISIPLLLLYALYATIYVAYTLVTGHSSHAWDTVASITALAFNSRPTKALENTGVRISKTQTFRNLVSVQEVEADERLELVFQRDVEDRGVVRRVRAGKTYS